MARFAFRGIGHNMLHGSSTRLHYCRALRPIHSRAAICFIMCPLPHEVDLLLREHVSIIRRIISA